MLNGAEMKLKVKFITKVSGKENSILLHPHENMDDFSDKVLLENSNYRNIFGKPFNESGNKPWKRGIVKISNGRRSTHLLFYSGNSKKITSKEYGISPASKHQLFTNSTGNESEIEISKGCRFWFFWNHPSHYQRVAFKLGILGLFISIINLVPLFVTIFK
jgi:hypothetical protein